MPEMTDDERRAVKRALRRPVGRYTYERASQLSGVPQRTLHHWARAQVFVPDFNHATPKQWTYRDLVLVRCFVWLRSHRFSPAAAGERVEMLRQDLERGRLDPETPLRAAQGGLLVGDEAADRVSGVAPLPGLHHFLDVFDLVAPADDLARVWGPDLVHPSRCSYISPWVHAGEPCVRRTRLRTAALWALHEEQGLPPQDIAALYAHVDAEEVDDAIELERKIRHLPVAA